MHKSSALALNTADVKVRSEACDISSLTGRSDRDKLYLEGETDFSRRIRDSKFTEQSAERHTSSEPQTSE